jgi:hypothetical protein
MKVRLRLTQVLRREQSQNHATIIQLQARESVKYSPLASPAKDKFVVVDDSNHDQSIEDGRRVIRICFSFRHLA